AGTVYTLDAVMPREPFIHERVIGIQQIQHASVLTNDAGKQQFRFAAERLSDVVVEVWEHQKIRCDLVQIAQLQPLSGEFVQQRVGAFIRDHSADLRFEHTRLTQAAGGGESQQLVVGEAAPKQDTNG